MKKTAPQCYKAWSMGFEEPSEIRNHQYQLGKELNLQFKPNYLSFSGT